MYIYRTLLYNKKKPSNKDYRMEIIELQKKIEVLTKENSELMAAKHEYNSSKQSFSRMSMRLRKLCKRLEPTDEIVLEMRKIADEIRVLTRKVLE